MQRYILYTFLGLALFTIPTPLFAQEAPTEVAEPETSPIGERIKAIAAIRVDLDSRITSARESVSDARAAQLGIPVSQLEERLRALDEAQRTYARAIDLLGALEEDMKSEAPEDQKILPAGLLEGEPPYSVREVDKVRAEADAYALAGEAADAERALGEESLRIAAQKIKSLEEALRLAKEAALNPSVDSERATLAWRATLIQSRLDLARAQHTLREVMLERAKLRANRVAGQREVIDEWASVAISNMNVNPVPLDAEWEEIFTELDEKRSEAAKIIQAAEKNLRVAETERNTIRTRLNEATEDEQRANLQSELTLAETQLRTAQRIHELAIIDSNWYDEVRGLWEIRRRALVPPEDENFDEMLKTAQATPGLIESRRIAWEGDLGTVRANISRLNALIDIPPADLSAAQIAHRRAERDSLREREKAFGDAFIRAAEVDRLAHRLIEDVQRQIVSQSWAQRGRAIWAAIQNSWNSELFEIDDSPVTPRKLVTALLLVIIGILLGRVFTRLVVRPLSNRILGDAGLAFTVERIFFYVLFIMLVLFALRTVNIPLTVFTLFGGALAIGIGLGGQTLANNFLSGLILLTDRPFKLGDVVEVDGHRGTIANIGARCSQLRLFNGVDVLVPNSQLIEGQVMNWTLGDNQVRFDVTVGVAYGSPTREVSKLMMRAVEEHGRVLRRPDPVVLFESFGDNSLVFTVYYWVALTTFGDARITKSDIHHRIDKLFHEAGIQISFPQRDVHFDTAAPIPVQVVPMPAPEKAEETAPPEEGPKLPDPGNE